MTIFRLFLFIYLYYHITFSLNVPESKCIFHLPNGSYINLTSLSEPNIYTFTNNTNISDSLVTIYYNPCYDFTLKPQNGICNNVALCQDISGNFTNFGKVEDSKINHNATADKYYITYSDNESDKNIKNVTLQCDQENTKAFFIIKQAASSKDTELYLHSKCACPDACIEIKADDKGLSTGSILIIVVLVGFCVYFFGGMLFLRFVSGATGIESIPNYEFWSDLPLLIRDGVVFAVNGCKSNVVYDRI